MHTPASSPTVLDLETGPDAPYFEIERVEHNNGYFMWVKGHPCPIKGWPKKESIEAVNWAKRHLLDTAGCTERLSSHIIFEEDKTPLARELRLLIALMGYWDTSFVLGQIFQYDEAYRFRLQDLFAETTPQLLSTKPIREILRLLAINKQRDYKVVHRKFQMAAYALCVFFLWPANRAKLRKAMLQINYTNLCPDAGDLYWFSQKIDYDYCGIKR